MSHNGLGDTILIVDDDAAIRELVREYVADLAPDIAVVTAETGAEAQAQFDAAKPDVVLLDMHLPDTDGLDVLARFRSAADVPIVVITADSSSSRTIRAIQAGAYDYLVKPLEPETVRHVVQRALDHRRLAASVRALPEVGARDARERIVGASGPMQAVYKLIGRVAGSDIPVLITGETGTGKELVTETLHANSARRRGPLIRVNCAALPESLLESELFGHEKGAFTGALERRKGRFELADGGTIFLDEIGDIAPSVQKKLLRVLQFGEFERVGGQVTVKSDVRVVAATNVDLEAAVAAGRFREDLYYRLNVIRIDMPPLRARTDDVPALVAHFLDRYRSRPGAAPTKISAEAMQALLAHDWPGNVRELENAIQRAVVLANDRLITPETLELGTPHTRIALDVDALVRDGATLAGVVRDVERAMAEAALRRAHGDANEAARLLDIAPDRLGGLVGKREAAR
ncbi:MAG: sigma-54-dependent Fis family transcriptional regulator [Ardenticatenales bacterium]|jgi:DNA-binding NtrC family response regulator|nr:sigma-54-dependent Fis family transcriptional regulator [Ardenticatenales bacterium]